MGKDLHGNQLMRGIVQRTTHCYMARYTNFEKERVTAYFSNLKEAEFWLILSKYDNTNRVVRGIEKVTVDAWFWYWLEEVKKPTVGYNTVRIYKERYMRNIKPVIGDMRMSDVRTIHLQKILNNMSEEYKGSTIEQVRRCLSAMFRYAKVNELIRINPVNDMLKNPKRIQQDTRYLEVEEQRIFLEYAKDNSYFDQFVFVLNTGLRTGEVIGLKFSDIDFEKRRVSIVRSVEFREGVYHINQPKSLSSIRVIPLTDVAYDIVLKRYKARESRYVADENYDDFIFLSRKGLPVKNTTYDTALYKITSKAHIKHISMHTLRHTFATRCIEAGMKPKALQVILGHSNLSITMNRYVHVTDDEKKRELDKMISYTSALHCGL